MKREFYWNVVPFADTIKQSASSAFLVPNWKQNASSNDFLKFQIISFGTAEGTVNVY